MLPLIKYQNQSLGKNNSRNLFIHSFTHSFHTDFLHATYVPEIYPMVLTFNKQTNPFSNAAHILSASGGWGGKVATDIKQNMQPS